MKQHMTMQEMATELARLAPLKADYVADTRQVTMLTTPGEPAELHLPEGLGEFTVTKHAHAQIADRLDVPKRFYDRIGDEHAALRDTVVNTLFRERPERRMVRTMDGQARAFLSDRYRVRDNIDLLGAVMPILGEIEDVRFESTALTDTRLYLKAVTPRVTADVKVGDTVQAGVVISNSEVGDGALWVRPMIFRLVCLNGMILPDRAMAGYHVGKRAAQEEDAYRVYSDETLEADDAVFFAKVGDVVKAAVDETRFQAIVGQMREAAGRDSKVNPIEGVERLGKRLTLTEAEGKSVLDHLVRGGDLTQYGYLNAVTRASQDVHDYDRCTELERMGGTVLGMNDKEWAAVVA